MAARLTTYAVVAIVAATLIAGLIVGAQRDDSQGPVDLIVFNAKVYTADGSGTMAEAVAIRGNQVLRVGTDREIERLRRPQTVMVDARGAGVLPGFNDSHVQFVAGALTLDSADLLGAATADEAQARIRVWAEANPLRPWVVGRGWAPETFADGHPSRQLLDAAVPDRPAYMLSSDGRTAWVNTKALRLAGVTRRTANPANGVIERDPRTGEPSGVLRASAAARAARFVPAPTPADRAQALRSAVSEAHRNGVTSVQDPNAAPGDFPLYEEARAAGDLNLRIYASVAVGPETIADGFSTLDALSRKYPDDPLFKVGGAHITLDGPAESPETALLDREVAAPAASTGETAIGADELNRLVRLLDARDWQVTIDAFGDRAVRMALHAFEHAARSNPGPPRSRRHRIEHLGGLHPDDLPRLGALGIVAVLHPFEARPATAQVDGGVHVDDDRIARSWPAASIAAAKGRLTFVSGWPAAALTPLAAIADAVDGPDPGAAEKDPGTGGAIALEQAIDAFTRTPAYASFDEQRKGSLAPGMLADLVVLSNDIFAGPVSQISSTTVAVTIFDGKIVYRRGATPTD
jgi:predicted amidohydrolase YtcJ